MIFASSRHAAFVDFDFRRRLRRVMPIFTLIRHCRQLRHFAFRLMPLRV